MKTTAPSQEAILRGAKEFSVSLNDIQVQQIQQYIDILLRWNEQLNLTAIRDPLEILYRHILESMYGSVAIPLMSCRLADVGSGAGFPGLPIKILLPDVDLHLIESNVKKATFLTEVVRELGLRGVRVLVSRYEDLGEEVAPLDVVCSRAVGEYPLLLDWAASRQLNTKNVALWIGEKDAEALRRISTWTWQEPKPIPRSVRRYILIGSPAALASDSATSV